MIALGGCQPSLAPGSALPRRWGCARAGWAQAPLGTLVLERGARWKRGAWLAVLEVRGCFLSLCSSGGLFGSKGGGSVILLVWGTVNRKNFGVPFRARVPKGWEKTPGQRGNVLGKVLVLKGSPRIWEVPSAPSSPQTGFGGSWGSDGGSGLPRDSAVSSLKLYQPLLQTS